MPRGGAHGKRECYQRVGETALEPCKAGGSASSSIAEAPEVSDCPLAQPSAVLTCFALFALVLVYAVIDDSLLPASPLGDALEVYVRREDAERFIEEMRGGDP